MSRYVVKKHLFPVGIACVVGLIYLLPHVLFIIEAGEEYHYPFLAMPDERHYATRIKEVYDGHYAIANPDLKEYKNSPYFWQPLCEIIVGSIGKILGIKIETLLVLSDFFFPCILFLVMYAFGYRVIGSSILAALGSCAILMVSIIIFGPPQSIIYWLSQLTSLHIFQQLNIKSSFLFTRSINPQINMILFISCMIGVYGAVFRQARHYVVLGGAILGALFYCNFYYWSYVIGGCGLFGLYSIVKRDWPTFWRLVLLVVIGGVLSIPYWLGVYALSTSPLYDEAVNRTYIVLTHKPYLVKLELATIFVLFVLYPKKDRTFLFLASFFLAGIICENQQIVTGRKMHPYHWSVYCQAPLMWIGIGVVARKIGQQWPHTRIVRAVTSRYRVWTSIALVFLFSNAVHTQIVYVYAKDREQGPRFFYEKSLPTWLEHQKLEPAFSWLNEHAKPESVVLAATWTSYLITSFTHCNILAGWHTHIYLVPDEELLERWLIKSYFFGIPDDLVYEVLQPNLDGICELCSWRTHSEDVPAFRRMVEHVYRKTKEMPIQDLLAKYDVEYILYSHEEREEFHLTEASFAQFPFLVQVLKDPHVELYKVVVH